MFRPYMRKVPIWSMGSHLELRAPILVPVSLRPYPKNFRHWQNLHCNSIQLCSTCCPTHFCRKYSSWLGLSGHKDIYATTLSNQQGVPKSVKGMYDISALGRATYNRPPFVMPDKQVNDNVPRRREWLFLTSARSEHFHNFMLKQDNYQKYFLTVIEGKQWNQYYSEIISAKSALSSFDKVLTEFCISRIRDPSSLLIGKDLSYFTNLFEKLFSELEIQEIWCLTRHFFAMTKRVNERTLTFLFKKFALMASDEILKRVDTLSSEEIFKTADMLFVVGMYRRSQLMKCLLRRMMNQDTTEQRVLFFFYMGLDQFLVPDVSDEIRDQHNLMTFSENLHINEVGIICSGLFRAKITIQYEKFGLLLLEKLENNLGLCHDVTISMIVKFLSYTFDRRLPEIFPAVYNALTSREFTAKLAQFISDIKITELKGSSAFRIIRLYSNIQYVPEVVIDSAVKKTLESGEHIKRLRLKDLGELVFRISKFPICAENTRQLFQLVTEEVMRRADMDVQKFRIELAHLIEGLILQDIYPFQLIKLLFSERTDSKEPEGELGCYTRLLFSISESVKIERPGYDGPLFKESFADVGSTLRNWEKREMKQFHFVPNEKDPAIQDLFFDVESKTTTLRSQFTSSVEEALECYLGDRKYFKTMMFLPHFWKYDIGFAVNETGDVIPTSEWITKEGQIKQDKSIRRIAIVPELERNALFTFMDRDGNRTEAICGRSKMQFRQMKKLGYEVVPILHHEFYNCKDRQKFLEQKLQAFVRKPAGKSTDIS